MKKSFLVAVVGVLLLSACSTSTTTSTPTAQAVSFPVTLQNNSTSVEIPALPKAIISLSPTATEMLFAIGAGSQVIAVDDQSNFPANAPKSELSGFTPNAEAIIAKHPDLVVLSNDTDGIVKTLSDAKISVLVEPAAMTIEDTYKQINELGTATAHTSEATALVADMTTKISASLAKVKDNSGLTFYHELDNTFYSVTSSTFIGSIYKSAGLTNIADAAPDASSGYPQLSSEFIVKANPSLVFLADTKCCSVNAAELAKRPGMAGLEAITGGNVVELDDDVASRWGPRVVELVDAIVNASLNHK